jgi:hypothetical protein
MRFKITIHSRSGAPEDALDRLALRLGARRDEVSFTRVGSWIEADSRAEGSAFVDSGERERIAREGVWGTVQEACEGAPDLRADWFAVRPAA